MKVKQIISRFHLSENSYFTENAFSEKMRKFYKDFYFNNQENEDLYKNTYSYLISRWENRVKEKWYGFNLGFPVPLSWYSAIDKFLEEVEKECPDFKILQIKLKMGGLRCYLENINEDIKKQVSELERVLFDKNLIY